MSTNNAIDRLINDVDVFLNVKLDARTDIGGVDKQINTYMMGLADGLSCVIGDTKKDEVLSKVSIKIHDFMERK